MAGVWKRDGTVAVTNGSKKVTGTGTTFADTKNGVAKGHLFCITSGTSVDFYEVDYAVSNTELYLVQAYRGLTATGKAYEIITTFSDSVPEFARRLTATLSAYQQQSDAFQALLTSNAATIEVPAPDGTKQTLIPWKRVTSDGEGQAARAKVEADKATAAANLAVNVVREAALPFPDVWIPFTDSLRMLAGYGREVKVGEDVIARYVNFERATNGWYWDKMGNLRQAAINEPRFEREGLLIEGPSTNLLRWDATRLPAGSGTLTSVTSSKYVGITAKKITGGASQVSIGASKELIKDSTVYSAMAIIDLANSNIPNGKLRLAFAYTQNWPTRFVNVDIATLQVTPSTDTTGTAKIYGDLLVITATTTSTATASTSGGGSIDLYYIDSSGQAITPPADASVCVVGFQLEEKPFSTSFILTGLASARRDMDKCWMPVDRNAPINTDFTMALEYDMHGGPIGDGEAGSASWRSLCGFYTAGAGFYNWLLVRSDDRKLSYCWGREGDRATIDTQGNGVVVGRVKSAMISIFNSGVKGVDKQTIQNPKHDQPIFAFGNLAIGSGVSSSIGDRDLYGHLRNVRIWHSARTDAQCVAIR
ncbi:hypothetical protein ACET68_19455 [Aeromonas rivipollensis]|uniref:phage head spike fiber domain-containing protein n=1 Tax=Aeromonas rivipollensis TaxID=948519 RepID=UPI0038D1F12C